MRAIGIGDLARGELGAIGIHQLAAGAGQGRGAAGGARARCAARSRGGPSAPLRRAGCPRPAPAGGATSRQRGARIARRRAAPPARSGVGRPRHRAPAPAILDPHHRVQPVRQPRTGHDAAGVGRLPGDPSPAACSAITASSLPAARSKVQRNANPSIPALSNGGSGPEPPRATPARALRRPPAPLLPAGSSRQQSRIVASAASNASGSFMQRVPGRAAGSGPVRRRPCRRGGIQAFLADLERQPARTAGDSAGSTGLVRSYRVNRAAVAPARASISTPVLAVSAASQYTRIAWRSGTATTAHVDVFQRQRVA